MAQIRCLLHKSLSNLSPRVDSILRSRNHRTFASRAVFLQLDYFMSAQFAGVAVAKKEGLYHSAGIDMQLLPECLPGMEPQRVCQHFETQGPDQITVGTIEQNVLVPLLATEAKKAESPLKGGVSAVAAMFARSPLSLVALPSHPTALLGLPTGSKQLLIGAHEDTVDLLQLLMPHAKVISVPREDKVSLLMEGKIDAVQVYNVMETLMLEEKLGETPRMLPLHTLGADLGYAQVIFAPNGVFENNNKSALLKDFLTATFDGWKRVARDPYSAAKAVLDMQSQYNVTSDHWVDSLEFTELAVRHCCDYVKATSCGGNLGIIDPQSWNSSSKWLMKHLKGNNVDQMSFLNAKVWKEDPRLMYGNALADSIRQKTSQASTKFFKTFGRKPSLSVITLGNEPHGVTHHSAERRLQLFSPKEASWFSKTLSGEFLGIEVEEINLSKETTTEELLAEIRRQRDKDGIQLMWPLPSQINAEVVYQAISKEQDIDGAHYIGRMETSGGHQAIVNGTLDPFENAPVTPLAVVRLMEHYGIEAKGKRIVVIGRSRIVGQPLAYMLSSQGGLVTVAHKGISQELLSAVCKEADIVIPCVGSPGFVKGDWVKPEAVLINVGTSFMEDELLPDYSELDELSHAKLVATCPGGVGPLSVAILFENVVENALRKKIKPVGATDQTPPLTDDKINKWLLSHEEWSYITERDREFVIEDKVPLLRRTFHIQTYPLAVEFIAEVTKEAESINHHPNWKLVHHCTEGVNVQAELFTYSANNVSQYDIEMAETIEKVYNSGFQSEKIKTNTPVLRMQDFNYDLPDEQIARFPAPRGTSRLLVAQKGPTISDLSFSDIATALPDNAHLVFNESRVFAARVYGNIAESSGNKPPFEIMFLNPEFPHSNPAIALSSPCLNQQWRAMIRNYFDKPGTLLKLNIPLAESTQTDVDVSVRIVKIHSNWHEEGEDDGVEATVEFFPVSKTLECSDLFSTFGEVPLPPYLNRKTEKQDHETYQTVYASPTSVGSVAAPTAGLHFTKEILEDLSTKGFDMSKLSLHVSSGTFRPVTAELISDHKMHEERFEVSTDSLRSLATSIEDGRPIVPVGTTSVRVLETLYWLGVRELTQSENNATSRVVSGDIPLFKLGQWDTYHLQNAIYDLPCASHSFEALCKKVDSYGQDSIQGITSLCIVPGYKFACVDALVTNFHQPDSTLLLLVAALVGDKSNLRKIYSHARENKYNFLSYGDACLLFNNNSSKI
mmetsp:Transcript_32243/g.42518  ORF Transcript_32243/g.42518 Transcript_32243/m.42518 type:complete len:1238 (+) Transcript_32243:106-3819(+)